MPGTVTFRTAVVLMLWCAVPVLTAHARATLLKRVEFESASQRRMGTIVPGDRIQGDLTRPDGAGPFPAVVGLHGCAGMHDATKQKLADELVARGYVVLLVESYATRGIAHACTSEAYMTFLKRRPDAYGALVFLAGQTFVDPRRVAMVGFSAGARLTLSAAEPNAFEHFVPGRLAVPGGGRVLPPCSAAAARPGYPRSSSSGPSMTGRRRQRAPIKSPAGATPGRRSNLSSIPARIMDSITSISSPAGRCLITGWNTTAGQRTMQRTGCSGFSIDISQKVDRTCDAGSVRSARTAARIIAAISASASLSCS